MPRMAPLYPLRFQPILRRSIWGGRRLGSVLGKTLGEGDDYAESWEVCDRGDDQSLVAAGPLQGASLGQLVRERGNDLLGRHAPQPRFPLLFKFLDAQPHSLIYAGLKRGFDRAALKRELARGTCELCLHHFEPRPGDCLFLPAGVVHAIGAGLLIAEIQQSSDVTYRLFDWNRVGADGRPRSLHVEQALDVIDFASGPAGPQTPRPAGRPNVERLVECDKFVLDRWQTGSPETIGGDGCFHLLAVIDGELTIAGD